MEPIRILQVVNSMSRGGAETMIMNLYRQIDRKQIQFDFLVHTQDACDYDDEIKALGGKVFCAPRYKIFNHITYCRWLNRFFAAHPTYHIIHGHQYSTASIYLSIAKKHGLTTIAHSHSTSNGIGLSAMVKDWVQRPLYRIADYRFACSEAAGKWLYRNKADFRVLQNAIDTDLFRFSPRLRAKMRDELNIAPDALVIGHVGRFCEVKNHVMLLDIFAQLHAQCHTSKLLLVGDGPLREELEQKAARLGLTDEIIFMGIRTDVADLMQAMDVFVLPSLYEGLPVTVVEAQAAGLPCIIADTITQEVCLSDLVQREALSDDVKTWADTAIAAASTTARENMQEVIRGAGYDIRHSAATLTSFYQSL